MRMLVGQLAAKSGFSRDTIRYYEKLGLIQVDKLNRHANNYKNYSPQTLQRLDQITELKAMGFTLTEIVKILDDFNHPSEPCANLPAKLNEKISQISEKILALESYKQKLVNIKESCNGRCNVNNGRPGCITY